MDDIMPEDGITLMFAEAAALGTDPMHDLRVVTADEAGIRPDFDLPRFPVLDGDRWGNLAALVAACADDCQEDTDLDDWDEGTDDPPTVEDYPIHFYYNPIPARERRTRSV